MRNKKTTKALSLALIVIIMLAAFTGCSSEPTRTQVDRTATLNIGNKLAERQPTPTDIDYSLERYNLIRRTYWVNGQREKAMAVPCPLADVPLGYCVLFTESGAVVGSFVVDGKVSSLNSFLTPDSEYYEQNGESGVYKNQWLPDVDGSYGENDNGIFFFTPDGKYIEWTGIYLYSDIPFIVENPVVSYEVIR
jgi:hypothetical protein